MHIVRLVVATSTGPEEVLEEFSYGKDADASWILSWDPGGQQVVFGVGTRGGALRAPSREGHYAQSKRAIHCGEGCR